MKNKQIIYQEIAIPFLLMLGMICSSSVFAQNHLLNNVKISVTFSSAPNTINPKFTYLKYNKAFVLVLQADDATTDIYNKVFPFFAGKEGNAGLFMTDGTGNKVPFSMELNYFTLKARKDVHETDTTNYLSWKKINDLWQNGYSVDNRGFADPAYGSAQDYQVQRNVSYTIKMTAPFTKGGITMDTYVLPPNGTDQMFPARNVGFIAFFKNPSLDLIVNPIVLESINQLFYPPRLFLRNRVANTLFGDVQVMALQSNNSHHWMGVYNFRKFGISPDISFASFKSQMEQVAAAYGKNGADNIWVAGDQEVFEYFLLKEKVLLLKSTQGNVTQISFVGNKIPGNMHWYALTLMVTGNQPITNVLVQGAKTSSQVIHGDTALINFSWNGRIIEPEEQVAARYIQLAKNDPSAANCLIASDYVDAIQDPDTLIKYHNELCAQNFSSLNVYCSYHFTVPDVTICLGDTALLKAPDGMKHYLWNTGDTVQSIRVSPPKNTQYWVEVTSPDNKTGRDTTTVFVDPIPVFEHSSDTVITQPGADTLLWVSSGYPDYLWSTGATDTSILVNPVRNTRYSVKVTSANGCSTTQNFLVAPYYNYNIDFKYDTACFGDSTTLINISTGKDSLLQVSWDLNMDGKFDNATGDTVTYAFPKSQLWLVGMRLSYKSGNILTKVHQVPVGDKPVVDFSYRGLCSSVGNTLFTDSTTLAFGKITTRYWEYGDSRSEYRPNIYAYHQYYPGNYTATLVVGTSYGCVDSLSKSFSIYGSPDIVVQRKDSSQVYNNDSVKFNKGDSTYVQVKNPSDYDSIIWPPHILSPDYYVKASGEYTVQAYINVCPGTTVFYGVAVGGSAPITSAHAMPFFTPNGDGYNDKWVVNNKDIASPFKLRIYNRAGSLVYSSENYNNDWTGEYNGNPLPQGTYYYVIIDKAGKKYTGALSIIR